jgi:HAMP domain-containing protein
LSLWNGRWNDVAATMALAQAEGLFGRRKASSDHARAVAEAFPLTIGAYVIYEPDADGQDAAALAGTEVPKEAMDAKGRFVPYWYVPSGPATAERMLQLKPNTDMETLEYYLGPKTGFAQTGKAAATLTEPYLYEGELMVSHTFPIVRDGKFVGITGVDRSLDLLSQVAEGIRKRVGGDVFIVSAGRRFIAATTDRAGDGAGPAALRMREVTASPYAALAARWREAAAEGTVFEDLDPVLGERCLYATSAVAVGGWRVVVRRTEADALRDARSARTRNILLGVLGSAVIGGLLFLLARAVSRRVRGAAEAADRIARGDLSRGLDATTSRDETGQLVRSMGTMDRNLNALIGSVNDASVRLGSTATEIAATSREQETAAATVGSAVSEIAAAVHEISATGVALVRTMASVSENAAETARPPGRDAPASSASRRSCAASIARRPRSPSGSRPSTNARSGSPRSSRRSRRSPTARTSSRSTPRSRPRRPARAARASS